MFTDVHCHLNYTDYGDLEERIKNCRKKGVDLIVTSGFDMESSLLSRDIAKKYGEVYFSAGWQPQELGCFKDGDLDNLKVLCKDKKCVAVGEIGLDYHYPDNPDKAFQKKILVAELELADELNLPVIIHSRDCAEDMLTLLKYNRGKLKNGGVMHCYSHSREMVKDFLSLGLYLSFGGTATYKGSKKVIKSVMETPTERILSETDSPYLSPEPLKGTFPNSPENIPVIVKALSLIRGEDEEELASAIRKNALTIFKKIERD